MDLTSRWDRYRADNLCAFASYDHVHHRPEMFIVCDLVEAPMEGSYLHTPPSVDAASRLCRPALQYLDYASEVGLVWHPVQSVAPAVMSNVSTGTTRFPENRKQPVDIRVGIARIAPDVVMRVLFLTPLYEGSPPLRHDAISAQVMSTVVGTTRPRATDSSLTVAGPAPDLSRTVSQYVAAGMPSLDCVWTPDEYKNALLCLQRVAREDVRHLPRGGTSRSAPIIRHMLDPRSHLLLRDRSRMDERHAAISSLLDHVDKLLELYDRASGVGYGTFSGECFGLTMACMRITTTIMSMDRLQMRTLQPGSGSFGEREARDDLDRRKLQFTGYVGRLVRMAGDKTTCSLSVRKSVARTLLKDYASYVRHLTATDHEHYLDTIKQLAVTADDEELMEMLAQLIDVMAESGQQIP